jgi:hypothetical protein
MTSYYEFDCDALSFGFYDLNGADQDGDRWGICAYDNMIDRKKLLGY